MTMSSPGDRPALDDAAARILAAVGALVSEPVQTAASIAGGGNNAVWRVTTATRVLIAKSYACADGDQRDRLGTEFGMLSFLWNNDIRAIPRPIACDPTTKVALYEYLDGAKPVADELTPEDVCELAKFLSELWLLRDREGATNLPAASERCHRLSDYIAMIDRRRSRLQAAIETTDDAIARDAKHFLLGEFDTLFAQRRRSLEQRADFQQSRTLFELTLSPSDQGFHNALRTPHGWKFIDFEYSGWDDPAKMLADTLHQPGVPIPSSLHEAFLNQAFHGFATADWLPLRFQLVEPLVCLNWVLILLNEFIPEVQRRRTLAGKSNDWDAVRATQLGRAQGKLRQSAATESSTVKETCYG